MTTTTAPRYKPYQEFVPTKDETFVLSESTETLFKLIEEQSEDCQQNILLTGPTGCGKTTTAQEFAARHNRPLLTMDCAPVREPRDWFGYRTIDPQSKDIIWVESLFARMVAQHRAVIVLDEINRVSPLVVNALMGLTDPSRRETYIEEAGKTIHVGPGVVFFATMNQGCEYTGTLTLDKALLNRFRRIVECDFLPIEQETELLHKRTGLPKAQAKKLAEIAAGVRAKAGANISDGFSEPISTRLLLGAAADMVTGGPATLQWSLLNHYSNLEGSNSERTQLLKLLVGKFGQIF